MKIHEVKQGSPEWLALRLGVVTASEIDALVSPTWKVRTGEGPTNYLYKKVCEKFMGFTMDTGSSWHMDAGSIMEHEALPWFEFDQDVKVDRVGFITSDTGEIGCSPDGLIGEDGGIELKCPSPPVHLKYLMENNLPAEYRAQVNFSMYVTHRKWWKFVSYSRQMPPMIATVPRDEVVMAVFDKVLSDFLPEFKAVLAKVRALKSADNAAKQAEYDANPAAQTR